MEYKLFKSLKDIKIPGKTVEEVVQELYSLWRECFHDTKAYADFYFEWKVKENQILTLYKEGRPSSMLHLNPYLLLFKGKELSANYIVGVATRKEDRRQGLMKRLLEAALNQMYEEKMPFTYLMPAAESIYLPFDFRIVYKQENWDELLEKGVRIWADKKVIDEDLYHKDFKVVELKSFEEEKIKELVLFTNYMLAKQYNIYTKRTKDYYKRMLYEVESTKGGFLLCYRDKILIGYAAYMADGGIHITESIYEGEEKEHIFSAFADYLSIGTSNELMDRENFIPSIMTRIVNVETFLEGIESRKEAKLILKVEDNIITANNGIYECRISGNGSKVRKMDMNKGFTEEPDISVDISRLTQLFFGELSFKDIRAAISYGKEEKVLKILDDLELYDRLFINDVV